MCWSGEASAVLAAAGMGATAYVVKKGESNALWMPLGYFSLMELLQAGTYVFIDQCDSLWNQWLTHLGYIHIAFQPIFANMVAMYFVPPATREGIRKPVYAICALAGGIILIKMIPADRLGTCAAGIEGFCGSIACSFSGMWHIAWQLPLNGLMSGSIEYLFGFPYGLHAFVYILAVFVMPLAYGSWRFVAFHCLMGPVISDLTTSDPNEFIAVWCLFSIALCIAVIKSPIRRHLHVGSTWFPHLVTRTHAAWRRSISSLDPRKVEHLE